MNNLTWQIKNGCPENVLITLHSKTQCPLKLFIKGFLYWVSVNWYARFNSETWNTVFA